MRKTFLAAVALLGFCGSLASVEACSRASRRQAIVEEPVNYQYAPTQAGSTCVGRQATAVAVSNPVTVTYQVQVVADQAPTNCYGSGGFFSRFRERRAQRHQQAAMYRIEYQPMPQAYPVNPNVESKPVPAAPTASLRSPDCQCGENCQCVQTAQAAPNKRYQRICGPNGCSWVEVN